MSNSKFTNITLNYMVSNFAPRAASLMLLPVFLRLMEISIWGEISLLLAFQIVFVNISSWGLDSLSYRVFQDFEDNKKNEFIKKITKKFIVYNLIFLTTLEFALNTNLTSIFKIDYGIPFRLTVLIGMLLSFTRLLTSLYKSINESVVIRNSVYLETFLIPTIQLLLVSLVIYFYGFEDRMIVTSYFVGQFFGTLAKVMYLKSKSSLLFSTVDKQTFNVSQKMQQNYSNLSYVYALFSMLLVWQDRFFLSRYYTLEEVAEYSTVYRLVDLHGVFMGAFVAAFAPILWSVNTNKKQSLYLFKLIISLSSLLGCLGVCISTVIGPLILPLKYQEALVIIPYLAIGMIVGGLAGLYGLLLEKKFKVIIRVYSMAFGALVNFLVIYFTIEKFSILGLSFATASGYFIVFLINYFYADKEYKSLLRNREAFISFLIIGLFIVIYRDVWFLNLFFLTLSVLILGYMLYLLKKLLNIQNEDFQIWGTE